MQHVSLPNGVLRLAPYLSAILPESNLRIDSDVQYLYWELVAAAKCASLGEQLEDSTAVLPLHSSPSSLAWGSSSTALDSFSRAGFMADFDLDAELSNGFTPGASLPPSSPPQIPSSPPQMALPSP